MFNAARKARLHAAEVAATTYLKEASKMISDAGITDEYLAHCLLYESEAVVWAAWGKAR